MPVGDVKIQNSNQSVPRSRGSKTSRSPSPTMLTVRLRFNVKVSHRAMETIWHPSQVIEEQSDGSIIMTFKVRDITYFRAFILGWGDEVEVLEPETLREQIKNIIHSLEYIYSKRDLPYITGTPPGLNRNIPALTV